MAESIRNLSPNWIHQNPENPRLIFRENELQELEESIDLQGILVPLTVYESSPNKYVILDGERRWRCAHRLGLRQVPVIVQPKPTRMQNIMMMFAIHNARKDWDPLPTAMKLQQLEELFYLKEKRNPTEAELAQVSSMPRGEVRRLKLVIALPKKYKDLLLKEGDLPRSDQRVTVDHVLEAVRGSAALRKRELIDGKQESRLISTIISKYQSGVIKNTVEPRLLAKIARAVDRSEVTRPKVHRLIEKLMSDPQYSIERAFKDSVARIDIEHGLEQQVLRLTEKLEAEAIAGSEIGKSLQLALKQLNLTIRRLTSM